MTILISENSPQEEKRVTGPSEISSILLVCSRKAKWLLPDSLKSKKQSKMEDGIKNDKC